VEGIALAARRVIRRILRYARTEESALVHRLLRGAAAGVMLDVGAHHGGTLLPFARDGWTVHAFEPDPDNRIELERVTCNFDNVIVVPSAVSDSSGEVTLYASDESTGISSLAAFTEGHRPRAVVDVTTLTDYVEEALLADVTFLKIDVEGFEKAVLNGFPWGRLHPDVVLLEFEDAKTEPLGHTWRDLADFLVAQDYSVLVSEWYPIVAYGSTHRWRGFQRYPADLVDPRAWGNLIAVRRDLYPALARIARRHARRVAVSRLLRVVP